MKRMIWIVPILFVLLFACSIGLNQRQRLLKLMPEMSKEQVIQLMGIPYKNEAFSIPEGPFLEAYFYVTDNQPGILIIEDREMTPIIFIDGKVIGWGWSFYRDTTQKYDIDIEIKGEAP